MGMQLPQKGRGAHPVINVTPLVDVVLVLLIIFMVITPLLEKHIDVSIPKEADPAEAPPPDPQNEQLVVAVAPDGSVTLNDRPISRTALALELTSKLRSRREKVVFFNAHDDVLYRDAVSVLDITRGAGAETIGTVLAASER